VENWYRLIAWMALRLVIYFSYSYKRSELRLRRETAAVQAGGARRR
jgi:hypothetical protein